MISMQFVKLMENTAEEARKFFEHNPSVITAQELIKLAESKGILNDANIDADLFRHLMKKYTAIGY